jgi:ABC-2 type transport system permease protein
MKQMLAITRKELSSYFGSPMALIFVGVFLAATLFSFFWIDTFFARGLADARPLFRWMPVLLIFLVAALTMRQWSEEEQSGTLEILLTLPIRPVELVLGKFLAVLALVAVALALTLFIPITVSILGNLDWGPVIGGYLAALLLAGAYGAIGLFISSRTSNQIVALILTTVISGIFYAIGTRGITELAGSPLDELFRLLATGSRFESIERGVIDLRDLVYYLSLTVIFLTFNVLSLDSKRWNTGRHTLAYRRNAILATGLIAVNALVLNIWLQPLHGARLDITAQRQFSLSATTRDMVSNLQEPLLIRGYFSENTHPLLSPLVPRIEDMLREYEIAGDGMLQVEMIDPLTDPDLEAEANRSYGIRPTPFQIAGRHESALVNAYFDILLRYGDQHVVLNFRDLIEIEQLRDGNLDVRLRNLEYDLTRGIKRVVFGFQSVDAILASLDDPAKLTLFVTPDTLPAEVAETTETIQTVATQIAADSGGKFSLEIINPDAPDSPLNRQAVYDTYGLEPIAVSLFSPDSYYLHMVLQVGDAAQLIFPSGDMGEADVRTAIESGLKRASSGFLKTVGLVRPSSMGTPNPATGQVQRPFSTWELLAEQLRQEYEVRDLNLSEGSVPADIDILMIIAPENMTDVERYAVDQYLMRGGSVVVAGGNYRMNADTFSGELILDPVSEGLKEMLAHYGVEIQDGLVLDPQNEAYAVPTIRDVGGFQVRDYQAINYPFFVDVRPDGMATENPIMSNLPAVTLNWVAPLAIDEEKNAGREATILLSSSDQAWLRADPNIQPDLETYPELGFPIEGEQQSYPLAIAIQGSFESYFRDKPNPLTASDEAETGEGDSPLAPAPAESTAAEETITLGAIETSPQSARLVVIGSADFLNDAVFDMTFGATMNSHLNKLQFAQNVVDWSVEDLDLLAIRARGAHVWLLDPLSEQERVFWEALNYAVALLALLALGLVWNLRRRHEKPMTLTEPDVTQQQDLQYSA